MHHGADYTPYEGMAVTGWPVMTVLRGEVAAEDGKVLGAKGAGQFLKRDLSPYARPTGGWAAAGAAARSGIGRRREYTIIYGE